jgi:hypothetical protein
MPGEYKKIFRLASKSGVDYSTSVLEKGGASGHNWHVESLGGSVTKRPGLAPCASLPATDEEAYSWTESSTRATKPFLGVLGAATHILDPEVRAVPSTLDPGTFPGTWYDETVDGYTFKTYREPQEIVFVTSGRLCCLRTVPAILVTSSGRVSYSFWPDSTGALVFTLYEDELVAATYTVDSSSSIADVATAIGGTVFSGKGQADLSATCLKQTKKALIQERMSGAVAIPCWITHEVPGAMNYLGLEDSNRYRFRAFSSNPAFSFDTPVQGVQYGEWLLLAGQHDTLFSYDGFRLRKAGTQGVDYELTTPAGSLTGTFNYLLRPKFVSPRGVVSYGPTSMFTATLVAEDQTITLTQEAPAAYVSGVRSIAPNGTHTSLSIASNDSESFTLDLTKYVEDPKPQIHEKVFLHPEDTSTDQVRRVEGYSDGVVQFADSVFNTYTASTNEQVEIFRTVNGGTAYYLVDEIPLAEGSSYTDSTSDATLVTQDVLIETAFTPVAAPDMVVAATVHQNRAIVVGEYLSASTRDNTPPLISSVFYTEPNTQEFTADNSFTVNTTNGDELVACFSHDGVLYIASTLSLWNVTGDLSSATSFSVDRIPSGQGVVSNCGFATLRSTLFALSRFGVFTLAGGVDYTIGTPVNPLIRQLSSEVLKRARLCADEVNGRLYVVLPGVNLDRTSTTTATTTFSTYQSMVRFVEETSATIVLVYDVIREAWYVYRPQTPVGGGIVALDGRVMCFPKRHEAPIVELNEDYKSDAWTPIEMEFATPWEDLDDTTTSKSFVRAQVLSTEETSQNFVLETTTETDWKAGRPVGEFNLSFMDGEGYAENAYATVPYGDPNVPDHVVPLTNHKAKSMRLVFRNDDPAEKPTISGWVLEVAANSRNAKET